jgi:hypothetical protein
METNKDSISEKTLQKKLVFPLLLSIDPMERLLVASFKDDPEYEMIEPQLFDDTVNGKGLRILRYRKDKKVDVYWQPGVIVDPASVNVGAGTGDFVETKIAPSRFEITESGVDIDIAFTDQQGCRVELTIKENTRINNRFPFLAPVGKDIENPERLFLVDMLEFDFVKRKGTVFHAKVGDRILFPSSFPILRDKQKVYLTRYASNLVIGVINPPVKKPVVVEYTVPGPTKAGAMNLTINEKQEVENIWIENSSGKVEMFFHSAFPNLLTLPQNKMVHGRWEYSISGAVLTGGTYSLLRNADAVDVEFDVLQKWKPGKMPFSFKIFTCIMRSFRTWPTTYRWKASVDLKELSLDGYWQRK